MTPEAMLDAVISMGVESWRFGRVFKRLLPKLEAGEQKRYKSQFRWFIKKVDEVLEQAKKIEEAIKQADLRIVNVEGRPFDPGMATTLDAVISVAVEYWRFRQVFDRLLRKLDAGEQNRYESQFRWFTKKVEEALEQADLRIVNVEGHPFDPGMAATPLNIEEFDAKDALVVEQMLEPVIMGKEGIIKIGTVILRKVEL